MGLIPDRAYYSTGQPVVLEFSAPAPSDSTIVVTKIAEEVRTVPVARNATTVELGTFETGGYGVRCGEHSTAFDVLSSPFERPRYGFVASMDPDVDVNAVARNFRRLHLNLAQFYDWGYRHSQLLPPSRIYTDPLGQDRDLDMVNRIADATRRQGTVPLGYSAVYAVGTDETSDWADSLLLRADGEPYRLGEDFLVLVDPAEPRWLAHYLGMLEEALGGTSLQGFHLDQYGWPKFAIRGDGRRIDLAASFVTLLNAVRERLPHANFMFNNVNDFPTWATATAPQDATYIEVWDPHSTLQDLAGLASAALAAKPEHPPILSAYLSCFTNDEARATQAAEFVMATAWSHGASHLLLGETGNALIDPYYPNNHVLRPESLDRFVSWYDFAVRYGDLLFDPRSQDVTESFTGGINGDVTFAGAAFSTKATEGAVWTRVVRTPARLVIHVINLTDQTETVWDRGKNPVPPLSGLEISLALAGPESALFFADVDHPDLTRLPIAGASTSAQSNALSAAQSHVTYSMPPVGAWAVLFLPAAEFS
jgi:dextranase